MADTDVPVDEDWAADMIFGSEPSAAPRAEDPTAADDVGRVDLDHAEPAAADEERSEAADINAGAKKAALALGATLVLGAAGIVAALATFGDGAAPPPARPAPTAVTDTAAPTPTTAAAADQDQAIPFTASANCPAGSTSAQALTDMTTDSAWVCVRGAPGARVDGQVLHVDFGRSQLLTAVAVTPGWVAKTPGGKDEWVQHRVVTRFQYVFNDEDRTVFTQDTGSAHGPVTTPLPRKVLASRATVIVLQTSRPPASPPPSSDPTAAAQPGFIDSILGAGGAPPASDSTATAAPDPGGAPDADPVDATFAVSALKFFGHQPN